MMNASIKWPDKWDAGEILGEWWSVAFNRELTDEDINDKLFDRIRKQLLINYGDSPLLIETERTKFIKSQLIF